MKSNFRNVDKAFFKVGQPVGLNMAAHVFLVDFCVFVSFIVTSLWDLVHLRPFDVRNAWKQLKTWIIGIS